jgi:hypothetical protein
MKVLRDPLGRPIDRLYFKTEVLDERCERKIADSMERHGDGFRLPIPTSEIIRMIVAEAGALDLYADLPEGVDGYTDYFTDRNPEVKIRSGWPLRAITTVFDLLSLTNTATSGFTRRCGENPNRTRRVRPRRAGPATATRSATPLRTTGWNGRPITSAARC